jgi:glutamate-5-semialdehyde dehydrogenase
MSLTNATPLQVAQAARLGSRKLAVLSTEERNAALIAIHAALATGKEEVLAANAQDLEAANKAAAGGTLSASLVKRDWIWGSRGNMRICCREYWT